MTGNIKSICPTTYNALSESYNMRTAIFISALILTLSLSSCELLKNFLPEPDQYRFNRGRSTPGTVFGGLNISEIDSVEQTGNNAILLHSGGAIGLRVNPVTDFIGDFTVNIKEGRGVKFTFRTTTHDITSISGITFNYTGSGSWIEENGQTIARLDTVRAIIGQQERIQISNEGKLYTVQVGCTVIYRGKTNLPATEYIIPSTFSGSTVLLTGMDLITIRSADTRNTPKARAERERW